MTIESPKCPLRKDFDCLLSKCAWYDKKKLCCAILLIAQNTKIEEEE